MADVEKTETPEVDAGQQAKAAADAIRDLFATLDPPAEIEVQNVYGRTSKVRNAVPARNQMRAMRELEKLAALATSPDMRELAQSAGSGVGGVVGFLVRAAMREDVLDMLCTAFAEAHPAIVDQARADAKEHGVSGADKLTVADLFPVEEVVSGLVPFLLRLIRKGMTAISSLSKPNP
jgi:hypothetical protein